MPNPITIPRLGWNMEEGVFGGWLKADGDPVRVGEPIFTLESEKATEEVESLDAGFLRVPADGPKPGDKLAVGAVIGYLTVTVDEAVLPVEKPGSAPAVVSASRPPDSARRERERPEEPRSSPRARRAARELGVDL